MTFFAKSDDTITAINRVSLSIRIPPIGGVLEHKVFLIQTLLITVPGMGEFSSICRMSPESLRSGTRTVLSSQKCIRKENLASRNNHNRKLAVIAPFANKRGGAPVFFSASI